MNHKRRRWLAAALAWTGLILFSSTSLAAQYSERAFQRIRAWLFGAYPPEASSGMLHFIAEKSVHLTLFFVLGVLLSRLFSGTRLRRFAQIVVTGLIVGSVSEFLQRFFPGRDPALRDVLINLAGAALGAVASIGRK